MKKCFKKLTAFSMSDAIVAIVLMGLIGTILIPQWKAFNPAQKGWDSTAKKVASNLTVATTNMLSLNASLDDLTHLKHGGLVFSIEDADVTPKMANLFSEYMSKVDTVVDMSKEYFSQDILDYKRNSTGVKLKDAYSNFHFTTDGVLMGYHFFGTCDGIEQNTNLPLERAKHAVTESCGSVFYDVNAYKKPNKLGSDQYIIPVDKRGMKFDEGSL